ncbi:unnamed protein product [Effrenium voratum]|nr:unnamed protein product [Effrenium voratum]
MKSFAICSPESSPGSRILGHFMVQSTSALLDFACKLALVERVLKAQVLFNKQIVALLAQIDSNSDGRISRDELHAMLEDDKLKAHWETLGLTDFNKTKQADRLFDLLDENGDGAIYVDEFLDKCGLMRGPASALELLAVQTECGHIRRYLSQLIAGNTDYIRTTKEERQHFPWVMEEAGPIAHVGHHMRPKEKRVRSRAQEFFRQPGAPADGYWTTELHSGRDKWALVSPVLEADGFVTVVTEKLFALATILRVAWSFWDKGLRDLSEFRLLCIETWRSMNPGWVIQVLDARSVWDFLQPSDLPKQWEDMYVAFQSDAVRLALLQRYGGLWIDPATICLRPFETWICGREGLAAFYFSSWGTEMGKSAEYVENWVLACRRGHPMIARWKELFNGYWDSIRARKGSLDPLFLPDHPMFCKVDLSHMQRFGHDMRSYLVMHSCFKKMIDEEPEMRRVWQEEMVLLRADEHALWHMDEPDVCWQPEAALRKWLGKGNAAWEDHVIKHCPVLKFTRTFAQLLDREPRQRFLMPIPGRPGEYQACCLLGAAFCAALAFEPVE